MKESHTIKEDLLHELSEKDKQYNAMKKDLIDNLDKQQIKYDAVKDSNSKLQSQIESLQEKVQNLELQVEWDKMLWDGSWRTIGQKLK